MDDANLNLPEGKQKKERSTGRKTADGTEQPLKVTPIKEAVANLMKLYKKAQSAKADFKDAVTAVAKRSNAQASTISKLIRVSEAGQFKDTVRDIEQQSDIFDAVGEVAGGKASE